MTTGSLADVGNPRMSGVYSRPHRAFFRPGKSFGLGFQHL
jgi:hypothetical protein